MLHFRIILTFLPSQVGMVHSTEFCETAEVVIGDVFHLDVVRSADFNVSAPVKSMVLPMAVYGIPLYTLKLFNSLLYYHTGLSIITSYLVFVIPRISMLCLSFVMDYCIYNTCLIYNHSFNRCLTTLASSYITLLYVTRTLSNSMEMILFTVLLYLVLHCMKRTSETIYLQSMVQEAYDKAESIREKVDLRKKKMKIPSGDFKHFFLISVICAIGIFNHPSFIIYLAVPLFYWFQRGISNNSVFTPFIMFHFRMASLIPGKSFFCNLQYRIKNKNTSFRLCYNLPFICPFGFPLLW